MFNYEEVDGYIIVISIEDLSYAKQIEFLEKDHEGYYKDNAFYN